MPAPVKKPESSPALRPAGKLSRLQRKRLRANPSLIGIPEFEAMKGNCRDLSAPAAIAETDFLSRQYRERFRSGEPMVDLYQVIRTLTTKKIPFVLTGLYGMSTWIGRPRGTQDVDVLVKAGRNFARAVKALREIYPELETHEVTGVMGFFNPGEKESLLDVIYPHRPDLQATLDTGIWTVEKRLRYRIPTLECALANKYGAMLNLARSPMKRAYDMGDFAAMVKHSLERGRKPIDMQKLGELGDAIWLGGGAEITRLVEEARAGQMPRLDQ